MTTEDNDRLLAAAMELFRSRRHVELRDLLRSHVRDVAGDFRLAAVRGDTLKVLEDPFGAVASYRRAAHLAPRPGALYAIMVEPLVRCGLYGEALETIERALATAEGVVATPGLAMEASYLPGVDYEYLARVHGQWWRSTCWTAPAPQPPRPRPPGQPIRIGFFSADFRYHPVGNFLIALFGNHDRGRFELIAFNNSSPGGDPLTQVLRQWAEFVEIHGLSDDEVHALALRHELDVAVDLSGHSRHHRLGVFARRVAPVQISWAGYVGTTGVPSMDYLLADAVYVTAEEERHFTETVLRMPHSYAVYTPYGEVPIAAKRRFPADQLVFGCFNNPKKVNTDLLHLYARILVNTDGLLLFKNYQVTADDFRRRVTDVFGRYGIADRAVFEDWSPQRELLETYNDVDLSLDTMPYNGGFTTCESLYMGVPVVSMRGRSFAARHTASYAIAAGLSAMIAETPDDYVNRAVDLGRPRDVGQRAALRAHFLASPVCDGPGFCRHFETIVEQVVARGQ